MAMHDLEEQSKVFMETAQRICDVADVDIHEVKSIKWLPYCNEIEVYLLNPAGRRYLECYTPNNVHQYHVGDCKPAMNTIRLPHWSPT